MSGDLVTRVVRKIGSEKTHVVDAPPAAFAWFRLFGKDFVGLPLAAPVATRCGTLLRGANNAAASMRGGSKVTCPQCRRITGLTVAAEGNEDMPAAEPPPMRCPECGEPAQHRAPTAEPWAELAAALGRLPEWSHLDGEPLCPVMTSDGYRPAAPEVAATERED